MLYLTEEQHLEVLQRFIALARSAKTTPVHAAGLPYTSLMICFLMHHLASSESLITLFKSTGSEWFPRTVGFAIVRPMFEIDVTSHYISQQPEERSQKYIGFHKVLDFNHMSAVKKHRNSAKPSWSESMNFIWQHEYAPREIKIVQDFEQARPTYQSPLPNRPARVFHNWSGLTLKEMARAVDHLEAYDVFYSDLSSYAHADVHLVDSFLKVDGRDTAWSMRAHEGDFAFVVRYAISFLECFLTLFGTQFDSWQPSDLASCWNFPENN